MGEGREEWHIKIWELNHGTTGSFILHSQHLLLFRLVQNLLMSPTPRMDEAIMEGPPLEIYLPFIHSGIHSFSSKWM